MQRLFLISETAALKNTGPLSSHILEFKTYWTTST
jgi:hypothetical protein